MRAERHEVGQQDSNAHLWHVAAGITGFAVIMGLVGAGFAWTFAHRGSERLPLQEIGTIASPDRPAKVPPVAIEALQPEQGATVSNSNEGAPMGKVVASEEQPIAPPNAKFSAEEAQVAGGKPESASAKTKSARGQDPKDRSGPGRQQGGGRFVRRPVRGGRLQGGSARHHEESGAQIRLADWRPPTGLPPREGWRQIPLSCGGRRHEQRGRRGHLRKSQVGRWLLLRHRQLMTPEISIRRPFENGP